MVGHLSASRQSSSLQEEPEHSHRCMTVACIRVDVPLNNDNCLVVFLF